MGSLDNSNTNNKVDVPVLIVGGGPAGLLLAYLLSRLDVPSLVVEKYPTRLAAPKAHALSPRSLEICRQYGLDTRALRKLGTPRKDAYWVNFVPNLSAEQVGVLPYERMDQEVLHDTPEMIHNIPQPDFEQFVADHLTRDPRTELRKGVAFISCEQSDTSVLTLLEERLTKRRFHVRSRYVVGCDGAKSAVREHLGIKSEGEDSYETMMTIHFRADLRSVLRDRTGMLHWILDPATSGFIIGYDLSGNQVLITNFDSQKTPTSSWNEAHCRQVLSAAIGQDISMEILSWRPWILSRKVAKQYQRRNVLLAGDAAHSFPPTGGLGLNTGIADVHNLAYKLQAALHGYGGSSLLDSYGTERRQVAVVCSKQSTKNGQKIFSFLKTLGTVNSVNIQEARRNLLASIRDPAKQDEIQQGVEAQREHFDNLELHIGYVYGEKETPPHASHYEPKFCAGARLPHAFIRFTNPDVVPAQAPLDLSYVTELEQAQLADWRYSTLDLCAPDAFTLLVGKHTAWADRGQLLRRHLRLTGVKLNTYTFGEDVKIVSRAHAELYQEHVQLAQGEGLLVRPDQHILARVRPSVSDAEIVDLVQSYLGLGV